MNLFQDIVDLYLKTDHVLQNEIVIAANNNDDKAFEKGLLLRDLNDQAYFLFLFTRFESVIHSSFDTLLTARSAGSWNDSRIWILWGQKDKISLLDKVSMLYPKGGREWNSVREYYAERNNIGHGSTWTAPFVIPDIAIEMDKLASNFSIA